VPEHNKNEELPALELVFAEGAISRRSLFIRTLTQDPPGKVYLNLLKEILS
jgi:hypothetical protein